MLHSGLPILRILPLRSLVLHEEHDVQRALPLGEKLRAEGILRNPPIVMPLPDRTRRYIVLDGANRVTALNELQFPHTVAQVVEAGDPHVGLHPWNHVVWGIKPNQLLARLRRVKGLELHRIETARSVAAPHHTPVQIRLSDGSAYYGTTPTNLQRRVRVLKKIVASYSRDASIDRTSQTLIDSMRSLYESLAALVIFPRFDLETVLDLAGSGTVLPAGITRFTVSPRALHLNYPLHELSSGRPLAEKERYLQKWIESRVSGKGVRMYVENTFLFDE